MMGHVDKYHNTVDYLFECILRCLFGDVVIPCYTNICVNLCLAIWVHFSVFIEWVKLSIFMENSLCLSRNSCHGMMKAYILKSAEQVYQALFTLCHCIDLTVILICNYICTSYEGLKSTSLSRNNLGILCFLSCLSINNSRILCKCRDPTLLLQIIISNDFPFL